MPFMRVQGEKSLYPFFDFLARYVRKLHSDRHIKNSLSSNPGMSFLDMIGASDIAYYIICVLKNNYAVWSYDPTDRSTPTMPKPLYTRGESKKREYGKTTISKDGMKFFNKGLLNWKKVFSDREGPIYGSMKQGWETWLRDDSGALDSAGWRQKSIHALLRSREVDDGHEIEEGNVARRGNSEDPEVYCYDSDGQVNLIQHGGIRHWVPATAAATAAGMGDNAGEEDEEDYLDDGDDEVNPSTMEDNRKHPYVATEEEDDEEEDEDEEDEVPATPPLPPGKKNRKGGAGNKKGKETTKGAQSTRLHTKCPRRG